MRQGIKSHNPTQSYSPALGAFTPQCPEITSGCPMGRQGTGRKGRPRAFTHLILGLILHEGIWEQGGVNE